MEIVVTNHAVQRFRQRHFKAFDWPEEQIRKTLESVVKHGKVKKRCPGKVNEVVFQGLAIRMAHSKNKIIVITFLGNSTYQKWYRKVG
jgi:hypothetical protein